MEMELFEFGLETLADGPTEIDSWPLSDADLPFPTVVYRDVARSAGQFEFSLGGRFFVDGGSIPRWGNSPFATARIIDSSGKEVRRTAVTMRDLSASAPRPPADLSKIATITSEGLPPGLYTIQFEARWASIVHLSTSLFFSGGVLSLGGEVIWGELFSPSREARQGIANRSFKIPVG